MQTAIFNPPGLQGLSFRSDRNVQRPWRIEQEHTFTLLNAKTGRPILRMDIEPGLDTDLASIPWFMGWLFPMNGWHIPGCAYHDEAYSRQGMSRAMADFGLRVILNEHRPKATPVRLKAAKGMPCKLAILFAACFACLQVWLIWAGVRLFGWYAWRKNREAKP